MRKENEGELFIPHTKIYYEAKVFLNVCCGYWKKHTVWKKHIPNNVWEYCSSKLDRCGYNKAVYYKGHILIKLMRYSRNDVEAISYPFLRKEN